MQFDNFDLLNEPAAVIVAALDRQWDLHNFAVFQGLEFHARQNVLVLVWAVDPSDTNPWGDVKNHASGCRIVCSGVRNFSISARDEDQPPSESDCLRAISRARRGEVAFPFKEEWKPEEEFDLFLEFEDSGTIRIDSERARFEEIP